MPPSPSFEKVDLDGGIGEWFEHLTRSALHAHVGHLVHGGRPAVDDHELGAVSYGLAHDPQPGEYRQARARHQDDVAMAGGVHGLAHGGGQPLAEEDDVRLEQTAARLARHRLEVAGPRRVPVRLRSDRHPCRIGLTRIVGVEHRQPGIHLGAGDDSPAGQTHDPVVGAMQFPHGALIGPGVQPVHVLGGDARHQSRLLQAGQGRMPRRRLQGIEQPPGGVVARP